MSCIRQGLRTMRRCHCTRNIFETRGVRPQRLSGVGELLSEVVVMCGGEDCQQVAAMGTLCRACLY